MATVESHPVYTLLDAAGAVMWQANVRDDDGTSWIVTDEDGWSTSPPVRRNNDDREGADGAWDNPAFYSGRTVSLTGLAVCGSQVLQNTAKDTLDGLLANVQGPLLPLIVEERHRTRRVYVRRDDLKVNDKGPAGLAWQLTVYAPDPRKYDNTLSTPSAPLPIGGQAGGRPYPRVYPLGYTAGSGSGSVQAPNNGNYPSPAVLTITGPISSPGISHVQSGNSLRFNLTLAAGDVLVVDLDAKSVVLNGTGNRRSSLTYDSAWFYLATGSNELRFTGNAGSGAVPTLTAAYRHAWI